MKDVNEDWPTLKERYQKIIRSYQANDLSHAYSTLQHKYHEVVKALNQQIEKNTQLVEQLNKQENKMNSLQDTLKEKESLITKEIIESHVIDSLIFHIKAFNQLITILSHSDLESHLKEVEWIMFETTEKKTDSTEEATHPVNHDEIIDNEGNGNKETPKLFNFQDLQSYQNAYLLPIKKEQQNQAVTTPRFYYNKKKVLEKLKEKQMKKILEDYPIEKPLNQSNNQEPSQQIAQPEAPEPTTENEPTQTNIDQESFTEEKIKIEKPFHLILRKLRDLFGITHH
ncbi:hypothetical protein [Amphibacillus cookii]|uniref:hypothetical protein n=1 Tax=Amphibacillus cookii TaxID=767787 RepID=UPI001957435F|nr:hypothetical protein [Amphibacillus cookii]MBM7543122.1 hypothetical protein [Amphibacillus cookii]